MTDPRPQLQAALRAAGQVRHCRGCGCSRFDPCPEGCGWIERDLCSACPPDTPQSVLDPVRQLEDEVLRDPLGTVARRVKAPFTSRELARAWDAAHANPATDLSNFRKRVRAWERGGRLDRAGTVATSTKPASTWRLLT